MIKTRNSKISFFGGENFTLYFAHNVIKKFGEKRSSSKTKVGRWNDCKV